MKVLRLDGNDGVCATHAASTLRGGGVIIYPTDTLYGLGADAFSDAAVDAVYKIKARDPYKPLHMICADMQMVSEYAELNDVAKKLAERFLPGAMTLVLKKKSGVDTGIGRRMETIGVRIPDNDFCIQTARSLGKPFTATSANLAGETAALSVDDIVAQLGGAVDHVELVIDAGTLPLSAPSTVVNVVSGHAVILREGAIPKEDILAL